MVAIRELQVRPIGYYHMPAEYGGLSQRTYRQLSHAGDSLMDVVINGGIVPFTSEEVYLAQMCIVNAAFRLVAFHEGQALPPERLTVVIDALDVLRSCGLDVNTRAHFQDGK